jgi:hypothetical protein
MGVRPALATLAVTGLLLTGCSGDSGSRTPSAASTAADPADPTGSTGEATAEASEATEEPTTDETDAGDPPDLPDLPTGGQCEADLTLSGDATGELQGGTYASIDSGDGLQAFYQAMGEDLLLSAYSEGNGLDPTLILQAGTETYGTDPGTPGLDIAADGSGLTLDAELSLIGSGDKTAHITGTMTCS